MKSKLLLIVTFLCLTVTLSACTKEKKMIGQWQASDAFDQKIDMAVTDNKITITVGKKTKEMSYKNSTAVDKNNIKHFSFDINKQPYSIVFPEHKDSKTALFIKNTSSEEPYSGALVYAINRDQHPNYLEYAKNYFNNKNIPT